MKHTKGAWELKMTGDGKDILINEGYIGKVHSDDIDEEEAWANAKLIAAAPDLLSCLQRFVDFADGVKARQDEKQGYISTFESSMILQAKEAIKKATE